MEVGCQPKISLWKPQSKTLAGAMRAFEKRDPERAARLLAEARAQGPEDELVRDYLLANALAQGNRPARALEIVRGATRRKKTKEQALRLRLLEAELLNELGLLRSALETLDGFEEKALGLDHRDLAAESMILRGALLSAMGEQERAIETIVEGLALARDIGSAPFTAWALFRLSISRYRLGDVQRALEDARGILEVPGVEESIGVAWGYRQVGLLEGVGYRFYESIAAHRTALNLFKVHRNVPGTIRQYASLGLAHIDMGDIGVAEVLLRKAHEMAESGDNQSLLAVVHSRLGRLAAAKGDFESSAGHHARDLEISRETQNPSALAHALWNMGRACRLLGDYQGAQGYFCMAAEGFLGLGDRMNAGLAALDLAALEPGLPGECLARVNRLLDTCKFPKRSEIERRPAAQCRLHLALAAKYMMKGGWSSAMGEIERAVESVNRFGSHAQVVKILYIFGRMMVERSQPELGVELLTRGLKLSHVHGLQGLNAAVATLLGEVDESALLECSKDREALRRLSDSEEDWVRDQVCAGEIVGSSAALRDAMVGIDRVAPTNMRVLVIGETGTGKELVARRIHSRSPRQSGPLVTVNCAALPRELVEALLFGHKRGAFTGAVEASPGFIVSADHGTLFLDEVGELPLDVQAKLLRVLENKEVIPVGSVRSVKIDVRIVSATNRPLREMVEKGLFREDLYYRLNGFEVSLPPLRERGHDVLLLAYHALRTIPGAREKGIDRFTRGAEDRLLRHSWPGNVRELLTVVERALVRADGGPIGEDQLDFTSPPRRRVVDQNGVEPPSTYPPPAAFQPPSTYPPPLPPLPPLPPGPVPARGRNVRDEAFAAMLQDALRRTGGNKSEAAKLLGVHRNTVAKWVKKTGR